MNKLSRKDIAMLEVLAVTQESKGKLAEYIQQREKAADAYKAFCEAVVSGFEVEKVVKEKPSNERRAEVIQRAKEFIGNRRSEMMVAKVDDSRSYVVDVSFIVNADKRTVVALLRGVITYSVRVKGIAKCNPSDVFNEHIGKAIALGRALGKDVSEFENASQPTEPVIGHKLSNVHCDDIDEITTIKRGCMFVNNTGGYWGKDTLDSGITKIIDDTNAQY